MFTPALSQGGGPAENYKFTRLRHKVDTKFL